MCAQDGRDNANGNREGEMILVPKEAPPPEDTVEPLAEAVTDNEFEGLPRTTTGVIRIMRAKGRPEMADLVEDLHDTHESVKETTARAKDLLKLLRTLQKKTTGVYPVINRNDDPVGEDA